MASSLFALKSDFDKLPSDAKELLDQAGNVALSEAERLSAAEKLHKAGLAINDTTYLIEATYGKVKILHDYGKFLESIKYLDQLVYLETDKESENYGFILYKYGLTYYRLRIVTRCVDYFRQALPIFEKHGNKKQQASCLTGIAAAYSYFNVLDKNVENLKELLKRTELEGGSDATINYNLATSYLLLDKIEKALFYFKEAEEIARDSDGAKNYWVLSMSRLRLVYQKLGNSELSKKYELLVEQNVDSLRSREKIGIHFDAARTSLLRKEWSVAEAKLKTAESMLAGTQQNDKYLTLLDLYCQLYRDNGQSAKYLSYVERHRAYSDSMQLERKRLELEVFDSLSVIQQSNFLLEEEKRKFEIEDHEKDLKILSSERNLYRIIAWSIIFAVLATIIIVFLRRRVKETRKRTDELAIEADKLSSTLEVKKDQLTSLAIYMGQNKYLLMRLRKELKVLRSEVSNDKARLGLDELIVQITEIHNITKGQQKFHELIEDVNTEFIAQLTKSYPQITRNDIQLIGLLKLDLSSKEIASLTNISSKSVDVKRHRLRKKMNLERGLSLVDVV